jgi:hypothetical protein
MFKLVTSVIFFLLSFQVRASNIIIVSASYSEAQPTIDACQAAGIEVNYFEMGISINAALQAYLVGQECANKHVIYIGSAGTFGEFVGPFLVTTAEVYWMPEAGRLNLGEYLPALFPPIPMWSPYISASLPQKFILTSPTISHTNAVNISGLPDPAQLVENMELYLVAKAIKENAQSFDVILGITNAVGPDAAAQYAANKDTVAKMTATYVVEHLKSQK